MDLSAALKTFIFVLSSSLLQPVLLLLCVLSLWIFFECGRLFADWLRRKRRIHTGESPAVATYRRRLTKILQPATPEVEIQKLLRQHIQQQQRRLDKFRIATRVGPALGLIGTLVPMGTALAGLGQGDLTVLTSELVLAYTTTVVGLMIGSLAFLIHIVRRRFIEDDILAMEYLTEKMYHEVHA